MDPQSPSEQIYTQQPPQAPIPPENSNKSFWKTLAIGMSIVSFCIALAVSGYLLILNKNSEPNQIACTMEAMLCPDGTSVGRTGPNCEFAPCPTPTVDPTGNSSSVVGMGCKIGGCSSQICQNETDEEIITTCEYLDKYACYKTARCEKQTNGQCEWTQTTQLSSCLNSN